MTKIPIESYIEHAGILFVTMELIEKFHSTEEVERFKTWMGGQTCGVLSDGTGGIYSWDYERWIREGKLTEQLPQTWD